MISILTTETFFISHCARFTLQSSAEPICKILVILKSWIFKLHVPFKNGDYRYWRYGNFCEKKFTKYNHIRLFSRDENVFWVYISQTNIGNMEIRSSTPEHQFADNPISQLYIPKTWIVKIADNLLIPIQRGHIWSECWETALMQICSETIHIRLAIT